MSGMKDYEVESFKHNGRKVTIYTDLDENRRVRPTTISRRSCAGTVA